MKEHSGVTPRRSVEAEHGSADTAAPHDVPAHTPGPWEVGQVNRSRMSGVYGETAIVSASGYFPACALPCGTNGDGMAETTRANARLIAAAPELLAALRALLVDLEGHAVVDGRLTAAEAAIAKAEGR